MRGILTVLLCATALGSIRAGADLLWDNNIQFNEFSGRATSPPAFPNIRVADDFLPASAWVINEARFRASEDAGWRGSGLLEVAVYAHAGPGPGPLLASRTVPYTREEVDCRFQRCRYLYIADLGNGPIAVAPGHYWIGFRDSGGRGAGTSYWFTSDGGPDGAGTDTGWFSLNAGNTWVPEGARWHHAFEIHGEIVPAPSALVVLALGCARIRRRRR